MGTISNLSLTFQSILNSAVLEGLQEFLIALSNHHRSNQFKHNLIRVLSLYDPISPNILEQSKQKSFYPFVTICVMYVQQILQSNLLCFQVNFFLQSLKSFSPASRQQVYALALLIHQGIVKTSLSKRIFPCQKQKNNYL
ncbi:unnamed protein product [Paramecium sonneborni]|uniref:Uncharacterized protein n=1 Tax=Paramecium sonneborni TaxID=65129 RepID=A0A8S1M7S2_9CILI|nr:unnamed protein product [Paramecium sonneborni]